MHRRRLAMHVLEPPVMSQLLLSPFSSASLPSGAMVWWAGAFAAGAMAFAMMRFERRAL